MYVIITIIFDDLRSFIQSKFQSYCHQYVASLNLRLHLVRAKVLTPVSPRLRRRLRMTKDLGNITAHSVQRRGSSPLVNISNKYHRYLPLANAYVARQDHTFSMALYRVMFDQYSFSRIFITYINFPSCNNI